jgi:hypothetical protein
VSTATKFWWEPILTIVLLLGLACVVAIGYRRWSAAIDPVPRHVRWGVFVAAIAAFFIRQFAVAPAFLHDYFVGPAIVTTALSFPPDPNGGPAPYGEEYGLAGFTVLSLCAELFGRSAETVFAANNVFSALTAIPLAAVAAFWAGSSVAGLYAAAIWATSPLVARIAHSEDMHTLGMLWVLSGLALLELALRLRSTVALAGAAIALDLALLTRQTFYPWLGIAAAMFAERWLRDRRAGQAVSRAFGRLALVALAIACMPIAARMRYSIDTWEFQDTLTVHRVMIGSPAIVWDTLLHHPILALRGVSLTVPLLGLIGFFVIAWRSRSPVTILGAAAAWFVAFFPTYPKRGSDWPFRFHFYVMAIIAAGAGAAWLMEKVARRSGRALSARSQVAAAVAVAILGLFSSATLENRRPDAEFVEYVFMRDALARLDAPFSVVQNIGAGLASRTPDLLAYQFRLPVVKLTDGHHPTEGHPRPFVFLLGLGCHAHSLPELLKLEGGPAGVRPSEETMALFHRVARDRSIRFGLDVGPPPTQMLAPCAKILEHSTPLVEGPEVEVEDGPPWAFFDTHRIRLRLLRWDPPSSS